MSIYWRVKDVEEGMLAGTKTYFATFDDGLLPVGEGHLQVGNHLADGSVVAPFTRGSLLLIEDIVQRPRPSTWRSR